MRITRLASRSLAVTSLLVATLTLSACGLIGGSSSPSAPAEITPTGGQAAESTGGPTPASDAQSTPTTAATDNATPSATDSGTPSATGVANIAVAPGQVTQGNVVFSFSVEPAAPMYDPSHAPATPTGDQQNNQPRGLAVLGGMALRVTNNFDPTQSAPADQPQAIVRHVNLQIKDKASGQLIPDATVTIDVLRDGRPLLQDQPLVPMVPAGGNISQMHYGNNIKFPGAGNYQIFVRTQPSPLLGSQPLEAVQFNVTIK